MNIRIFLIFLPIFFIGCQNSDGDEIFDASNPKNEVEYLDVSLSTIGSFISFGAEASSSIFHVSSNATWTITKSADASWMTVAPLSGDGNATIAVSVVASSEREIRTGVLTITIEDGTTRMLQVTQGGANPYIIVNPVKETIEAAGGDITVSVMASGAWQALPTGVNWLTPKANTSAQAEFTVAANTMTEPRSATIVFRLTDYEDVVAEYELTQRQHVHVAQPLYWYDITSTSGLRNTRKPFYSSGNAKSIPEYSNRFFELRDWEGNTAVKANGNVDLTWGWGRLCIWVTGSAGGQPNMTNGKLWQTINLPAGRYRFDVHFDGTASSESAYVVVNTGSGEAVIPNAADVPTSNAKAYAQIINGTPAGAVLSTEFTLDAASAVTFGFVATLTGSQGIVLDRVQLWEWR